MRKVFTSLCLVALGCFGAYAAGTPFTLECNFDIDSEFADGAAVPEGWKLDGTNFKRNAASYWGYTAQSGDNILGSNQSTSGDFVYTPLKNLAAGEPCILEFYVYNKTSYANLMATFGYDVYVTANSAQNTSSVVKAFDKVAISTNETWTKITATFTPETAGEYCFAINTKNAFNDNNISYSGGLAYDSFIIEGTEAEQGGENPDPVDPDPIEPDNRPIEAFTTECNFDIDSEFADGAAVPEGWKLDGTNFKRNAASYWGYTAQSGDNILGSNQSTSADVLYTPLVELPAGEACILEFYVYNKTNYANLMTTFGYDVYVTANSAQNTSSVVKAFDKVAISTNETWTKITATFTPETAGEYCFAINTKNAFNDNNVSYSGGLAYDSFIIEGKTFGEEVVEPEPEPEPEPIVLEPNEENLADCVDLPYIEDFGGANYDGTSNLPIGWHTTGSVTWITANHKSVTAKAGEYYIIASHNTEAERDDKAYTAFFNLQAGTEYTMTYSVYMQGNDWNDDEILYLPTLTTTIGTEQDADFHNPLTTFSERTDGWVDQTVSFTPENSGAYCFAFMLTGPVNSGYVFIDDLMVTAPGLIARVEPGFMVDGLYSLMDYTKTVAFEGTPVKVVNTSKYADSYEWTVEGAEPSTSTEANPEFTFPTDGEYTLTLQATNARGTRTTQRKVTILNVGKLTKDDQALHRYNSNQDRLYERGESPCHSTAADADYVTGFNHYYFDIAQRFELAKDIPVKIKQMTTYVTERGFPNWTADGSVKAEKTFPMSVVIYGADENGELDEENVLGRRDGTVEEILGGSGLGGNAPDPRSIVFGHYEGEEFVEEPIEATGTIYVAMHFSKEHTIDATDGYLGRSFIATSSFKHGHGKTSLYAKPYAKPSTSIAELNKWCTVDAVDHKFQGLGAYWTLWLSAYDAEAGVQAVGADGSVEFAAAFFGDDLCVSGTAEGETVLLYNLAGQLVTSAKAAEGTTTVALPALASGVYVVKCADHTAKVVK